MSSRIAAWGQPPVSTPTMRSCSNAPCRSQEFGVLAGEDVVGDHAQAIVGAQPFAQSLQQRRLAAADRPANAHRKSALGKVAVQGLSLALGKESGRGKGRVGMAAIHQL